MRAESSGRWNTRGRGFPGWRERVRVSTLEYQGGVSGITCGFGVMLPTSTQLKPRPNKPARRGHLQQVVRLERDVPSIASPSLSNPAAMPTGFDSSIPHSLTTGSMTCTYTSYCPHSPLPSTARRLSLGLSDRGQFREHAQLAGGPSPHPGRSAAQESGHSGGGPSASRSSRQRRGRWIRRQRRRRRRT